jgi:hypothetical protein
MWPASRASGGARAGAPRTVSRCARPGCPPEEESETLVLVLSVPLKFAVALIPYVLPGIFWLVNVAVFVSL